MVTQGTAGGLHDGKTGTAKVRVAGWIIQGVGTGAWQPLATNTSEPSWLEISASPVPFGFHLPLGPDCEHLTDGLKSGDGQGLARFIHQVLA